MKYFRLILIFITALAMTACHSQKGVTRGKKESVQKVALTGKADNKYTQLLMDEAYSWLGTPYKYGGTTKKGADCSGFVMTIYKNSLGIDLPRVSRDQGDYCRKISKKDLFPGDLVFFSSGKGKVNHVGLYVGDNKILHASSSQGVVVSDLSVNYFAKHFHHAGMVTDYRKKALASSGNSKDSSKQKNKKKTKGTKADNGSSTTVDSPSTTSGVPKDALEIPASQLFRQQTEDSPKSKTPAKKLPESKSVRPDSTTNIQADTVHLMVFLPKK